MDYKQFINQTIINSYDEKGIVVGFDDTYIVIKYKNEEKTYNRDIAFSNGFLAFTKKSLNLLINQDMNDKEELKKKRKEEIEKNNQFQLERRKKANRHYKKLSAKNRVMKALFGADFIYPPYVEFKKKYKNVIEDDSFYCDNSTYCKYL